MLGKVLRYGTERGFGFILGEDNRTYFVHHSSIMMSGFRHLKAGQRVRFESVETPKGFEAEDVAIIGKEWEEE